MITQKLENVSEQIANEVRSRVPRSFNRLKTKGMENPSEWATIAVNGVPYASLIGSLARMSIDTDTKNWGGNWVTKPCVFNKTLKELKYAIEAFLREGMVGNQRVDMKYKGGLQTEKEYSRQFFDALAKHLNNRGFLWGLEKAPLKNGKDASDRVVPAIGMADRVKRHGKVETDFNLPFPLTYIRAQGKGAFSI